DLLLNARPAGDGRGSHDPRFVDDDLRARAHVMTRLRADLDRSAVLELRVRLDDGRGADALLPAQLPHRRQAVADLQRAAIDHLRDPIGELFVEMKLTALIHRSSRILGARGERQYSPGPDRPIQFFRYDELYWYNIDRPASVLV